MLIKVRFAKSTKPSAVAGVAFWLSLGSSLLYSAAFLALIVATRINPDLSESEPRSAVLRAFPIALGVAFLGALVAFVLGLIALLLPAHPRPRTHARVAVMLSAMILALCGLCLLGSIL